MVSGTGPLVKVFVDSSVLFAAALSAKGSARELILHAIKGEFSLYISPLVLEEVKRNLTRKAPAALPAFDSFRNLFTHIVDPATPLVRRVAEVVEVKDAPIVAAAMTAPVDYLASYDQKHLLKQKDIILTTFGVVVVTPDEVLNANQ